MRTRFDWREGWLDWVKAVSFAAAILCVLAGVILVLVFGGWVAFEEFVAGLPDTDLSVDLVVKWVSRIGGGGTALGALIVLVSKVRNYLAEPLSFDLRKHLKSPDFFDVEKFPTATFKSTAIEKTDDGHTITGDLTLHGVTKRVSFPATVTVTDGQVTANSEFSINRNDFGIVYPGMPDDLIRDLVVIKLSRALPRQG